MTNARYLIGIGLLANSLAALATPPVISLNYPPHAAAFSAPATIQLAVNASDPDGGMITSVEYLLGGAPLGTVTTAPFSAALNGVGAGTYTFTAKATDSQGEVTVSNAATVTVHSAVAGNTPPTVGVSFPLSGSAYSLNAGPALVPILINAADAGAGNSVNRIELFIQGAYLGSVSGGVLDTTIAFSNPGTYSIIARAYDNLGLSTVSAAATVNIYATESGNTPPISSLTSPLPGGTYLPPGSIPIAATASDAGGSINRVEFYRNNSLLYVMTTPPYTFGIGGVPVGNHTFRARAYDNLGVYTDSPNVSVAVNTPPTVNIAAPANNAVINAPASFNLEADATDADGNLSKVEFYRGTTLLGEDTSAPYSWSLNNVSWGTYIYTAKAYDALGAVVTSSAVNVVVNQPPTIGLTAASVEGGYDAPADILLTATPGDADGTISKVEFYSASQTNPISTRTVSPYTYTVTDAPVGTYTYTAKVYDSRSAVTTSSPVTVTVTPALSPSTYTYDELGRLIGVQH